MTQASSGSASFRRLIREIDGARQRLTVDVSSRS
jgi:hypothetical protein